MRNHHHDEPLTLREQATRTRDITARGLSLRADTVDEEQRSVEAVLATETPVQVFDHRSFDVIDEVLVMRGAELPDQLPLLENHDRFSLDTFIGSVRELRIEKGQLVGRLFFAAGDERAESVWNKVKQGHLRDVSVGYRSTNFVDIPAGKSQAVSGQRYTAGERTLRISTEWRPKELSVVPIGADQNSKVREDQQSLHTTTEGASVNKKLRKHLESLGLRSDATTEQAWAFYANLEGEQRAEADRLIDDSVPPERREDGPMTIERALVIALLHPETPEEQRSEIRQLIARGVADDDADVDDPVDSNAVRTAERERITEINNLVRHDDDREIAERAISDGWEVGRAATAILQAERDRRGSGSGADNRGGPGIHSRGSDDANREVLGAALMIRGGLALDHETFADVQARQALHSQPATRFLALGINDDRRQQIMDQAHRFAGLSAIDLCREAIRLDGNTVPHGYDDIIRSAVSGGSLSNVFTTSAYAQLIATYSEAMDSTRGWVREADVQNFQTNERPRLKKGGGFQKLPRGSSADHRGFDDDVESYKIARYAEQFVVDEQDLIDDRLNALSHVPMEMGLDAARIRPDLVYAILFANANMSDSTALFAAGRNNLNTSSALTFATLQAALTDMATHQEGSVNLNIRATHAITPHNLAFTLAQILESVETRSNQAANTESGTANAVRIVAGGLNRVHDSRLDNGVTDPSSGTAYNGATTDWFLADGSRPGIEVGYRRGTGRAPQMRSFTLDKGQWGVGWDINLDVGAKAIRALALHKSEA